MSNKLNANDRASKAHTRTQKPRQSESAKSLEAIAREYADAYSAFQAALHAPTKPRITVKMRTVRFPIGRSAVPVVRLLQALGCPLSPEAERWLHYKGLQESDRTGDA